MSTQREGMRLADIVMRIIGKHAHMLNAEKRHVLAKIGERRPLARDAADVAAEHATAGDRLATIGGSWCFIVSFTALLAGWMLFSAEILTLVRLAFDPHPYIFLNLMLSTLAAIRVLVIITSQNRLAANLEHEVNPRTGPELLRLRRTVDGGIAARLNEMTITRTQGETQP